VHAAWWDLFAPDLRAEVGRFELSATSDDFAGRSEYRAMLLWTISPGEIGNLRRRRAEEAAARLRSVETTNRAVNEVLSAEQDLEAARAGIPLAGEELTAAEETLRLSEARFKAGTAIAIEVLDAQIILARAHFNLARTIANYNAAQVRLLAATGTIERGVFGRQGEGVPAPSP
jgi:outer membrane protein TolC